ncbi:MAG: CopG family transcriptional regulator [Nautilia sp.]|nr:MAG: CopG family transcriptional regulator [Nautilia sp.]
MRKSINISLENDIINTLDEYANELEKTRTNLIEKALELYFDTLDEIVADKRIDNLKSGKTKVVSLEEVFKKAGINVSSSI